MPEVEKESAANHKRQTYPAAGFSYYLTINNCLSRVWGRGQRFSHFFFFSFTHNLLDCSMWILDAAVVQDYSNTECHHLRDINTCLSSFLFNPSYSF